jgi:hypothetical protein
MRSALAWLALSCLAFAAAGCGDSMMSDADRALKAKISGPWISDAKPDADPKVSSVAVYRADGSFSVLVTSKANDGKVEETKLTGEWFVTDGLLKTRIDKRNGTPPPGGHGYLTCRVKEISSMNMLCIDDVANVAYVQRRGTEGFDLPQ